MGGVPGRRTEALRTRWFRAWAFGLPTMGLGAHFFYRYMTRGWTEPWGGWNDVEAARPRIEK
jgi:hypothetical protein